MGNFCTITRGSMYATCADNETKVFISFSVDIKAEYSIEPNGSEVKNDYAIAKFKVIDNPGSSDRNFKYAAVVDLIALDGVPPKAKVEIKKDETDEDELCVNTVCAGTGPLVEGEVPCD